MTADAFVVLILLFFGMLGMRSGAMRQLSHLAGLACAYLAAWPLAGRWTPMLASYLGSPPIVVRAALAVLCFFAVSAVAKAALEWLWNRFSGEARHGAADRWGGFTLGLGKGGLVLFVLLSLAAFFERPLQAKFGPWPESVRTSAALGFARRHNLFETVSWPALAKLEPLMRAARDPAAAAALAKSPQAQALLQDPKVKALLQDEGILRALRTGDLAALSKDPRVAPLIQDPHVSDELSAMMDPAPSDK